MLHKTCLDVNEKGTEAAAVTKVEAKATSLEPTGNTFEMTANRPFLLAIKDRETHLLLFTAPS